MLDSYNSLRLDYFDNLRFKFDCRKVTSPSHPTVPSHLPEARRFVRHFGLHHFAHLRAVAEGLDIVQCAARYMWTEHGHEARSAHFQTVDAVRAIASRHGEL